RTCTLFGGFLYVLLYCLQAVLEKDLDGYIEYKKKVKGTNFQTVIVEVRKKILIDAIKNGLTIKEIYPLLGYPEPSNVYWFSKRFLGMRFNDFYDMIKNEI
uniref:hypothetical protein n=1 Tax=Ruminococcus sp. TaxID=41978 RepID=UPI0025E9E232